MKKFLLPLLLFSLPVIGIVVLWFALTASLATREKEPLDVLTACVEHGRVSVLHIHPFLRITVGDVEEQIPADIGITEDCMLPIHTHEGEKELREGMRKIHVESPLRQDFTLGEFFQVWGRPIERDGFTLEATVNNEPVQDAAAIVLRDKEEIELAYTSQR